MRRVLFLSHVPPYPLIGGDRLRIAQQLSFLLDKCEVDIAYISHTPGLQSVRKSEPRLGKEWRFTVPKLMRYFQASRWLLNFDPELANHFHHEPMQRLVDLVIKDYDFVFCASPAVAKYMRKYPNVRKFLDMTDSLTMNYVNAAPLASGMKKLFYRVEQTRMRRFERNCIAAFDRTAYISPVDRDFITSDTDRTAIVGNAVTVPPETELCRHDSQSRIIVFVGKMDYAPNELAVSNFARNVLPRLNAGDDGWRFVIVGACPSDAVRQLGELPGVEVTGFVESVAPYFRDAALVVAPMLSGSGIQNKILQAMAHGCCVATTAIGAEGITHIADGFITCDTDPESMASTINGLLESPARMARIGETARKRILENFTYETIAKDFWRFIER